MGIILKIGIVIPTYNEAENLPRLIPDLLALPLDVTILIVDDNSPDNTGALAEALTGEYPGRVSVLHRPARLGISSAYLQGFRCMLQKDLGAICQMDADLSHSPSTLIDMVKRLETCDVVFGSRYTPGGSVDSEWPFWRKGLSAWGNLYARLILRVPVRDMTTGYRVWRAETLRGIPLESILSEGYVFQVEMAYLAHCLEYRIRETPVYFANRCRGRSKMSLRIQLEAALRVWQIWLTHRHLCHTGRAARLRSELQSSLSH